MKKFILLGGYMNKKNVYLKRYLLVLLLVIGAVLPFQWACTGSSNPYVLSVPTYTYNFPPTPTPQYAKPPMGLWVVGSFAGSLMDYNNGSGPSTLVNTLFVLSVNQNAETTDGVTLITPGGSIPASYLFTLNFGTYSMAEYAAYTQYSYVPNGAYSMSVSTSIGTATASMNAPGAISFEATGASVTATYAGNYDSGVVTRIYPSAVTTYVSPNSSIGSPFVYPLTAYSSPSFPATFGTAYSAAITDSSVAGGAAGSAFVGTEISTKYFTR